MKKHKHHHLKKAQLFKNGQSQAVRLPKEFRFDSKEKEIFIKKKGHMTILFSTKKPWDTFVQSLDQFSSDFMQDREQPEQQERDDTL